MKKLYTFALVFAAALFTLSCEKEVEQVTVPEEENEEMVRISIRGTLDKEISKTAYDADGKMTWASGDQVRLVVSQGANFESQNYSTTTLAAADITEEGRNATFSGMVSYHKNNALEWLSTGFAVYPHSLVPSNNGGNYYNAPYIKLPSNVSGLASSIALIGLPDNDVLADVTNFNFKTAMAVMKVNITNIPAEATAIRLTSNDKDSYPVDGDFTLVKTAGVVTIGIENYQDTWGIGYQSVDISGEGAIASRDFFFNIPVGTYPANTLSFEIRKDDQVLLKKTISKEITFVRNECLTVPALPYHRVYVKGSAFAPKLYTVNPYTTIRVNISTSPLTKANYVSTDWPDGNKFSGAQDGWDLTGLKNKGNASILTSGGTNNYYLQYIVCSSTDQPTALSDANVVIFGSVPFRYIAAGDNEYDDPSILFGTYSIETIDYWNNYGTSSMTLDDSDDAGKGNVKITNILGHATALYGTYADGVLTVSENQEWYIDGNSSTHRLINNWSGTIDSTWNLTIAAADDKDLSLGNSYLVNEWFKEENKGYDNIWKSLEASKN